MVSIVIPAYNSEKTIERCLESVINQTYRDIEVIVVDDGSTDRTYEIVYKYGVLDKRIKIIQQKNQGVSAARNIGIENAYGEYLSFVDSDDIVYPQYIEKMLYFMEKGTDLVICKICKAVKRRGNKVKILYPKQEALRRYDTHQKILDKLMKLMSEGVLNSPYSKMYRMDIIKKNRVKMPIMLENGEDLQFNLRYIDGINSICLIPDILYQYNIMNSTLTTKYREDLFESRKISIDMLNQFLEKNHLDNQIILYLYLKLMFAECIQMYEYKEKFGRDKRYEIIDKLCSKEEIEYAIFHLRPKGMLQVVIFMVSKNRNHHLIDCTSFLFYKIRKIFPGKGGISV